MTHSTARAHTERSARCMSSIAWAPCSPSTSVTRETGTMPSRDVVGWLHEVDRVFSTYRHEQRHQPAAARGASRWTTADPDIAEVLGLCADARSPPADIQAMPNGRLDPTGLVKGWAIEHASRRLTAHGAANHGRQRRGRHAARRRGRVRAALDGRHQRPARILREFSRCVSGRDLAVATSGTAERGAARHRPVHRPPGERAHQRYGHWVRR